LEAILTKKGAELLKEWGIFKTKSSKDKSTPTKASHVKPILTHVDLSPEGLDQTINFSMIHTS